MYTYVEELLERLVQKGGVKSLLILLTKSIDADAQRFSALALGNAASAGNIFIGENLAVNLNYIL